MRLKLKRQSLKERGRKSSSNSSKRKNAEELKKNMLRTSEMNFTYRSLKNKQGREKEKSKKKENV